MPGEYYVWSVDKKPVEVCLNLAALERLQTLVSETFQRGLGEIHGMLLGRIERRKSKRRVYIEDFELFDPAAGPPKPKRGSWLDPVGLYRSRVCDQLRLDRLDAALIESFFTNPGMVYLLVRAGNYEASPAAFFIQENGAMQGHRSYREFPLDTGALRSGQYPLAAESAMAPAAIRWKWAGMMAGVAAALLAGWWFWSRAGTNRTTSTPATVQEAPAPRETPPPVQSGPEPAPRSPAVSPQSSKGANDREGDRTKPSPAKPRRERVNRMPDSAGVHDSEALPASRPATVGTLLKAPGRGLRRAASYIPGFGFLRKRDARDQRDRSGQ